MIAYLLMMPAALFAAAGTIAWPMGWIYIVLLVGAILASRLVAYRRHPDLLAERSRFSEVEDVASWDRPIVLYIGVVGPILMMIVAGLNQRHGWAPVIPPWLQMLCLIAVAAGYLLSTWAVASNPFFSAVVRIQHDRGQVVVSEGPYRLIRHPGYSGGVLSNLASPLMLGSFWALIPAISICVGLVVRTKLEDKLLVKELRGYAAYASAIRYRLAPGIW